MARLIFVGTDHDDLEGPIRLPHVVKCLLVESPNFIAVEYSEATYRCLAERRELAYQAIRKSPRAVPEPLWRPLANTLVYEPDAVVRKFLEPTWLGDGHSAFELSCNPDEKAAKDGVAKAERLSCRHFLSLKDIVGESPSSPEGLRAALTESRKCESRQLASFSPCELKRLDRDLDHWDWLSIKLDNLRDSIKEGRDAHMFDRLKTAVDGAGENALGIVIVGNKHLLDHEKTVLGLCRRAAGYQCQQLWLHEQKP